ncbi:MAG: SDR family NAD(P)-dependent oxidoreductase [Polaromonas sp.]|uniref:SDR family NAD(P)-dependent oxidoreductase n=1 Tax=Polaromonas sp. TaxID=1869339 RepID=UPI002487033F|nr:SDR family NAD(P)-dependent oxidoreductase [Polaromonas sp.]MDI1236008.1 SDR family NAD(P)-dependent oxidoreductase [Polaromonas sp.]
MSECRPGLAVVVGASGALGAALQTQLQQQGDYGRVLGLGRAGEIRIDYADEAGIAAAAQAVARICAESGLALRLLLVATGFLHGPQGQPERGWRHLDAGYLQQVFLVNTLGPALLIKHFFPLLPRQGRCVAGFVSARVGSIGDNALGGWYGYRASKAALNQLVKTAAIELTRSNGESICVALHPGTVDSPLSQPFAKTGLTVRPPQEAASDLLAVLAGLAPTHTGALLDYRGQLLPF